MNQELLDNIITKLHDNAFNYSVFLRTYEVPLVQPTNAESLIRVALGAQAELGGSEEVSGIVGWQEVEESLLYAGDNGAGPSDSILKSRHLSALIDQLRTDFFETVSDSKKIERFWLQEGHPAYPVFWDFAFLFWKNDTAIIFIGSSSD